MELHRNFKDAFSMMESHDQEEGHEAWRWLTDYTACILDELLDAAWTGDMLRYGVTAREFNETSQALVEFSALIVAGYIKYTGHDAEAFIDTAESNPQKAALMQNLSDRLAKKGWTGDWLAVEDM